MNKKIIQTDSLNQNQNKVKTEQKENNLPIQISPEISRSRYSLGNKLISDYKNKITSLKNTILVKKSSNPINKTSKETEVASQGVNKKPNVVLLPAKHQRVETCEKVLTTTENEKSTLIPIPVAFINSKEVRQTNKSVTKQRNTQIISGINDMRINHHKEKEDFGHKNNNSFSNINSFFKIDENRNKENQRSVPDLSVDRKDARKNISNKQPFLEDVCVDKFVMRKDIMEKDKKSFLKNVLNTDSDDEHLAKLENRVFTFDDQNPTIPSLITPTKTITVNPKVYEKEKNDLINMYKLNKLQVITTGKENELKEIKDRESGPSDLFKTLTTKNKNSKSIVRRINIEETSSPKSTTLSANSNIVKDGRRISEIPVITTESPAKHLNFKFSKIEKDKERVIMKEFKFKETDLEKIMNYETKINQTENDNFILAGNNKPNEAEKYKKIIPINTEKKNQIKGKLIANKINKERLINKLSNDAVSKNNTSNSAITVNCVNTAITKDKNNIEPEASTPHSQTPQKKNIININSNFNFNYNHQININFLNGISNSNNNTKNLQESKSTTNQCDKLSSASDSRRSEVLSSIMKKNNDFNIIKADDNTSVKSSCIGNLFGKKKTAIDKLVQNKNKVINKGSAATKNNILKKKIETPSFPNIKVDSAFRDVVLNTQGNNEDHIVLEKSSEKTIFNKLISSYNGPISESRNKDIPFINSNAIQKIAKKLSKKDVSSKNVSKNNLDSKGRKLLKSNSISAKNKSMINQNQSIDADSLLDEEKIFSSKQSTFIIFKAFSHYSIQTQK